MGLGNPGPEYERTRHNVGFRALEEAARLCGARLDQSRWDATYGIGRHHGEQVLLIAPQTFMNLSGESVGPAARFYKVPADQIVVIHDELDFEPGRLAVKVGGGDGGHNGLKSLRQHLGTGDFIRVRLGIGRPPAQWDPSDWVLSQFSPDDEAKLAGAEGWLIQAAKAALASLELGPQKAMNRFNTRPEAKKPKKEESTKP